MAVSGARGPRAIGLVAAIAVWSFVAGAAQAQQAPIGSEQPLPPATPLSPAATPTAPSDAVSPAPPRLPRRDWRAPGFVSLVEGHLYDPWCRPLRSAGSNLPNIMYRRGLRENLEWMRMHNLRWMRVMAFGHGQAGHVPGAADGDVELRLAALLHEVEAFNSAHDPSESIFVLITLTDYYEPGVPGDVFGFDKSGWCLARVLNAPWYRRGFRQYDFEQECGGGALRGAPNYEANYKPWVRRLVTAAARSPAVLGWQLGNEMKARNSDRNRLTAAYDWYLDWMNDITDTIRSIDRSHLVFAGAQYMAELTDWPYRPEESAIDLKLRPTYDRLVDKMLRSCGAYCWNVWSLTSYDFRLYAVDDAMVFDRAGVAVVITEQGLTLGTAEEEQRRFGGDRVSALWNGLSRSWFDIDGQPRQRMWSLAEQVDNLDLEGVAPWGSPNPDPSTDPGLDLDRNRGISQAPEGSALWDVWRQLASRLEATNRRAGVSTTCSAFRST